MNSVKEHFNIIAKDYDLGKKKNWYYYQELKKLFQYYIKPGKKILDFGCATGEILVYLKPNFGIGFDISEAMIEIAKNKFRNYPQIIFTNDNIEKLSLNTQFDFILLADVIEHLEEPKYTLGQIKKIATPGTKLILTMANPLWEPALLIAEKFGLKMPEGPHERISIKEVGDLLSDAGFIVEETSYRTLFPIKVPLLSEFVNKYFYKVPLLRSLAFIIYFIARPK